MKKTAVLGAGLVGSAIALDLAEEYEVSSYDLKSAHFPLLESKGIKTFRKNLAEEGAVREIADEYDLIIGAVPGFMGYKALKEVILAGKNIVDISFFPEDCFELDSLAKEKSVCAIVDFGVAPGIPNLLAGHHTKYMKVNSYKCCVGGLPIERKFPWQYKAPFSPADVLEEYTRPARMVENGRLVTKEALSDPEYINFEGIGTLEAFNTDGLRSLIKTTSIPNMTEKTLRYPGHIDLIKALKDTGFLDTKALEINGHSVIPLDFTSKLLFQAWKLMPKEEEFTVMKIIFEGEEDGMNHRYIYDLLDRYNPETDTFSMARTTGYAASAAANLILKDKYCEPGINPPEYIGRNDECLKFVFDYMKNRGINYIKTREEI